MAYWVIVHLNDKYENFATCVFSILYKVLNEFYFAKVQKEIDKSKCTTGTHFNTGYLLEYQPNKLNKHVIEKKNQAY